ncbi:MAG: nitrophenyl compound nitroreductase subunit ArsF family protein [Thermoguttaceae bacterium]|nr:nitrophenyl compound nitroreductase subunit ArsF family protein [Thermoguttaceae bacterium]
MTYVTMKRMVTGTLLLFAAVTLVVQIGKEFRDTPQMLLTDGLHVICTHATTRCPTCMTMERLTDELLHAEFASRLNSGEIIFQQINYEKPEVADFVQRFKVATSSVVLVRVRDGHIADGTNLADQAWNLYTDESAFKKMLKEQINAMFDGKSLEMDIPQEEIIFDENETLNL